MGSKSHRPISTRRGRALVLTAALAAVISAACSSDPAGPVVVPGRYELVAAEGVSLPATLIDEWIDTEEGDDFHLRIVLVGGVLTVRDGRYEQRLDLTIYVDGHPTVQRWNDRGVASEEAGGLRFDSDQFQNVRFHGTREAGGIRVLQDVVGYYHDAGQTISLRFAE